MTVRSSGALSPQGDDNIFFAIKIPLKLRPRKIQRRKLFKLGEILFLAITMCAFQQKLFLLPPPAGCRELSLPALWFHIHTEPRSLPWPSKLFPGWSLLLCPLPTLSSWLPHTFQTSLQAFTYNVTSRESSFPNPMAHVPRWTSILVLPLALSSTHCYCPSASHRDLPRSELTALPFCAAHCSDHSPLLVSWPGSVMSNTLERMGCWRPGFTASIQSTHIHRVITTCRACCQAPGISNFCV